MRLLINLITYNRIAYTRKTLRSLWATISDDADYFLIVTDNNSEDGTKEYLVDLKHRGRLNAILLNHENFYPGKACNLGWAKALEVYDATHLMRLDNDMKLTKGWDKRVEEYFRAIPELGQLGIEHEAIETEKSEGYKRTINGFTINDWPGCVGGPMVMTKKIWDSGIRYDEAPWFAENPQIPVYQEDAKLSYAIKAKGYLSAHAQEELGRTFATPDTWKTYPEYYRETMKLRGYSDLIGDL